MAALGIVCLAYTVIIENSPATIIMAPKGQCQTCCPINIKEDITFISYTTENPNEPRQILVNDDESLRRSQIDRNKLTVIYVYGFTEQYTSIGGTSMKNAYLRRGGVNVILVEWSKLTALPWYDFAVRNTKIVGQYLARFIEYLVSQGFSLSNIHVIGFSLGAEIAAFAGKELKIGKLPRITGLDPAYPLYRGTNNRGHLTPSDAEFVDVIHTDGGEFGFPVPMGHVDFFPNGGFPIQPGCSTPTNVSIDKVPGYASCSHVRAWKYYIESVQNPYGFPSIRCHSYDAFKKGKCLMDSKNSNGQIVQYMGIAANEKFRGKFYLNTRPIEPFANNQTYRHMALTMI
ncbi:pancreatic triacylglycerol lipase-like isoform X2 [Adelges cooleyi]|uniref:pancreatic triacylglycerol lipase-like isoform X2 n=1 Tax=Adelges cooleyi TaxID=133065 RepID=UPI00218021ED|nr:pancreatic triacylglycerol lipase-like isoform X2 [Adelges cooleyi]